MESLAIIGGSNGYRIISEAKITFLGEKRITTPFGKSEPIFIIQNDPIPVYYLSRHGQKGYSIAAPFVNYRANIYALKKLGVSSIISWSGPGAIDTSYQVGDLVLPEDILDETRYRERTFYKGSGLGFVRQNPVFCPTIRSFLKTVMAKMNEPVREGGVYVCTDGPRLETKAEIRKFALSGASFVGMTLAPECFLARELEMCYHPLCYITNYAEGVVERAYKSGELFEGMNTGAETEKFKRAVSRLPDIVRAVAEHASTAGNADCVCRKSMERYKKRGDIKNDWWEKIQDR
ncbi:MAG: MTAP family purine nucleoside phosphorylase [Spirochaetota bacterium]